MYLRRRGGPHGHVKRNEVKSLFVVDMSGMGDRIRSIGLIRTRKALEHIKVEILRRIVKPADHSIELPGASTARGKDPKNYNKSSDPFSVGHFIVT